MLDLSIDTPFDKYVCLDIGNVVFNFDIHKFVKHLSKEEFLPFDMVMDGVEKFQRPHDLGISSLKHSILNLFPHLHHLSTKDKTLSNHHSKWIDCVQPSQPMLYLIKNLKASDVKIAFLSNMGEAHWKHLSTTYSEIFAGTTNFISCLVGAVKPQYNYFHTFLQMYPEFKGALYLDDRSENIETARSIFKLKSHQFDLSKLNEQELEVDITTIKNTLIQEYRL